MPIKLLNTLFKSIFLLLLVIIVIGLTLPQNYSVNKKIEIDANTNTIKSLLTDFNQWHKWSPWKQVDSSIEFTVSEPSMGVGAHQSWQSSWGYGEMTITELSRNKMVLNILLNDEDIVEATLIFTERPNSLNIACHIEGQASTALVSGYMAIFIKYLLNNTLSLGLNNLKSVAQLNDPQIVVNNNDSQNLTSQN